MCIGHLDADRKIGSNIQKSRQRKPVVTDKSSAPRVESTISCNNLLKSAQIVTRLMPMGILLIALSLLLLPQPVRSDAISDLQQSSAAALEELAPNAPPRQPEIIYPKAGDTSVDLMTGLLASAFVDDDETDRHISTQWRIETSDTDHVVMDITCRNHHLRDLQIPQHVLDPLTCYRLRVRYFDASNLPSSWSEPVAFTTAVNLLDTNNNGVPDSREIGSFVDLNRDGTDDADQSDLIKSMRTHDDRFQIGVRIENGATTKRLAAVSSTNPLHLPDPFYAPEEMAYGLLGYRIIVQYPGQEATVTFHLSEPIDPTAPWLRYDSVMGWEEISDAIQADSDGVTVTRQLIDGGLGDADGAANGVIIDLCGPLTVNSASISDSDSNVSGGTEESTCFIQTVFKADNRSWFRAK
jgi:hypothetical protein